MQSHEYAQQLGDGDTVCYDADVGSFAKIGGGRLAKSLYSGQNKLTDCLCNSGVDLLK